MELNLKLNQINKDELNKIKIIEFLSLISNSKQIISEKRKKFAKRLSNIKKNSVIKIKEDAFVKAKEEYIQKFLASKDFYNKALISANKDCLDLSIKIATEIINKEIETDKNIYITKINDAIYKLRESNDLKIICNSKMAEKIQDDFKNTTIKIDNYIQDNKVQISSYGGSIEIDVQNEIEYLSTLLKRELVENAY